MTARISTPSVPPATHAAIPVRLIDTLIGAWALGMICVPVILWTAGETYLPWAISLNVFLLACAMGLLLLRAWGAVKAAQSVLLVLVLAWLLELVGSRTGIPFGDYTYTARFQPQIAHVPVIIPLAWLMMLPPAWAVAQIIAGKRRALIPLLAALAFSAWDLFLDPQMVAWGVWTWHEHGGYFGIPWQNFLGWILGALLLTYVVRPQPLPIHRPLVVYGITWFLQTVGLWLFWDMPGPALMGMLGMGLFLGVALWRLRAAREQGEHGS